MNYGGTTLFHIQQSTGNKVLIQYEVKDNPVFPSFQLEWTFPDDMNQDEMIVKILNFRLICSDNASCKANYL